MADLLTVVIWTALWCAALGVVGRSFRRRLAYRWLVYWLPHTTKSERLVADTNVRRCSVRLAIVVDCLVVGLVSVWFRIVLATPAPPVVAPAVLLGLLAVGGLVLADALLDERDNKRLLLLVRTEQRGVAS